MAEHIDPDRLDLVLASIGRYLVVESTDDDATAPVAGHGWRRRVLVAAAVVLIVSAAVASISPARRVVSGWLRAGNIDVEIDPHLTVPADLPNFVDDVEPLRRDELAERLGLRAPEVSRSPLGAPDAWWLPPEGGILATWNDHETSLWIVATVDTFPASLDKWLRDPEAAAVVDDLGDGGYVVEGSHIFQTPFRTVASSSVVAWTDGELTFRFDSTMPADDLVAVAQALATR